MRAVFADTFFYFALVNKRDPAHARATAFAGEYRGLTVTTDWVLTELADGVSGDARWRRWFVSWYADLCLDPYTRVVPYSAELFRAGLDLYARRPDKQWSLTDCTSFVVMEQEKITDALTGDHHFGQAGFNPLLDPA